MSWERPNIGSRVTREGHARFWERPEVKFLRATRRFCRKSLFAPSGLNFKSRRRANEKITWGESSLGVELTGDFRSRAEGLSNGDRRLFCLSARNQPLRILGLFRQHRPDPEVR